MPRLAPLSWIKFVKKMQTFDFDGPFQEGKHPYMVKGNISITIPNHHRDDISPDLLSHILRQAGISRALWMSKK